MVSRRFISQINACKRLWTPFDRDSIVINVDPEGPMPLSGSNRSREFRGWYQGSKGRQQRNQQEDARQSKSLVT